MQKRLAWLFITAAMYVFALMAEERTLFDFTAFKPAKWNAAMYTSLGKLMNPGKGLYLQAGKIPGGEYSFLGEDFRDTMLPELGIRFPPGDRDSLLFVHRLPAGAGRINNAGVLKSISLTLYCGGAPASVSVMLINQDKEEHIFSLGYLDFSGFRKLTWVNPLYGEEVRKRETGRQETDPDSLPYYQLKALLVRNEKSQPWFYPQYRENYKYRYMEEHYPRAKAGEYRQLLQGLDLKTLDTAITDEDSRLYIIRITIQYDKAVFLIPGNEEE